MTVLVIGDIIEDHFTYGKAIGISAETPTIVATETNSAFSLGGAALVHRHLLNLLDFNDDCHLLTMGSPEQRMQFESDDITIIEDHRWGATKKKRFFVDDYKMVQYDVRNSMKHDKLTEEFFIKNIEAFVQNFDIDIVIAADNRHGTINKTIARWLVENQELLKYKLYVDSQFSQEQPNHDWYKGCDTMFLNEKEFVFWLKDMHCSGFSDLSEEFDCSIVCKLGDKGAKACVDGAMYTAQAEKVDVIDTCGAGDAFLAAYVASKSRCIDNKLKDANVYAGHTCTMKGTDILYVKK